MRYFQAVLLLLCANICAADDLRVYLLTMGPGDAVYERFGHNALWVHDPENKTDLAYNYGLFDFGGDFLWRFIQGDMRYWMDGFDVAETIAFYQQCNRSVYLQELNLTEAQARKLRDFLVWNARPENKFYRYDYYRDNCSTRIRDAIDLALGGQLRQKSDTFGARTYRFHTRLLTADNPILYTALQFVLGPNVDRPLTAWDEMYLPERLRLFLSMHGELVRAQRTIFEARREPPRPAPPTAWPWFLAAGLLIGGGFAVAAVQKKTGRIFRFLAIAWSIFVGLCGIFLLYAWLGTEHWSTYRNANVLLFCPLALLIPLRRWRTMARWTVCLLPVLCVLGLFSRQQNSEMFALMFPAQLGFAFAIYRYNKQP